MSFDLDAVERAVAERGRVARVVIAEARGSSPREAGTAMLVWEGGQKGTIGGGALEYEATARARETLATGRVRVDRIALGPSLGQCCGGAVTLVTEIWDDQALAAIEDAVVARPLPGAPAVRPIGVAQAIARARDRDYPVRTAMVDGWLIEPVAPSGRALWIWGAGHVGRALAAVLAPLPEFALTWIDTAETRFPTRMPPGVTPFVAADPGEAVRHAPRDASHLILTYSHDIDLELCHRLLGHGFDWAGLIGSATKWARFRNRLAALGHGETEIARIVCPIGDPGLGKHPQAIALGVATALLRDAAQSKKNGRS